MSETRPATWANLAAWGTLLSVLPSGVWRVLVGLGVDLGWSAEQLEFQQVPGSGTVYMIVLSAASLGCAAMTFALVKPWGERIPSWFPVVAGRRVPPALPATVSLIGAAMLTSIVIMSVANWDRVSGFSDNPKSGWAVLMAACYLSAAAWPILLLAVTVDYLRRHRRIPQRQQAE
ncbi:hypothetical protein HLB23_25425 [Nocardia uniformis]|uniref:Uncharacterized protein n=1 Tax=Nocardia uniformis TaxID=53432 RepID=A0A849C5V3_9NOCA|nr:hypothetical protein [Nocardia uniformis]NNH73158.1 hypothetical protein [Nocardia uniformis]